MGLLGTLLLAVADTVLGENKTYQNAKIYVQKESDKAHAKIESKQKEYKQKLSNASTSHLKKVRESTDNDWLTNAIDDELKKRGD